LIVLEDEMSEWRPGEDEQLTERIIIPMTKRMVDDVTNYRFSHRLESRAEAVRQLIAIGLKSNGKSREVREVVQLNVRVPVEVKDQAVAAAEAEGITVAEWMENAIMAKALD
jgi:hypothetical protein